MIGSTLRVPAARHRYALVGVLLLGGLLRVVQFLQRPSLALDETRLALNIAARTVSQLMRPLDHDQSAPLLFLWAERGIVRIFGVNELALRLVPLLAGTAVLLVMYPLLRRLVGRRAALLGTAIVAVAPAMVAYSNEVKQYMVETLVAAVLTSLALQWLESADRRTTVRLVMAGVAAVWLSGSAVLVLAGIAPVLLCCRGTTSPGFNRRGTAVALIWALAFVCAYVVTYRAASTSAYMARFWGPVFLAPGSGMLERSWIAVRESIWGFTVGHSGIPMGREAGTYVTICAILGAASVLAGVVHLWRVRGAPVLTVLGGPLLVAVLASAVKLYPMSQRLLLFTVPLLVVLGTAGIEGVIGRFGAAGQRRAWWLVGGMVVLPLFAVAALQATALDAASHMRQLVRELQRRRQVGEPVYVFSRALPGWEFYATDWSAPDTARLQFLNHMARSDGPAFENAPSRGRAVGADEGARLVVRSPWGDEVIGLPTGMEYHAGVGLLRRRPDEGWIEREAERIQRAAAPSAWVLMSEFFGPEYELFDALKRRGGRLTYGRFDPGHILARYEFGGPIGDSS